MIEDETPPLGDRPVSTHVPGASRPPIPEPEPEPGVVTRTPIQMSLHRRSSRVLLTFSSPCSEFAMSSEVARQMADNLIRLAVEIEFRNR